MPFAPRITAPLPTESPPAPPALAQAARGGVTIFTAPPGSLPHAALAAQLRARPGPTLWVRLGGEDRDPAGLLATLLAALHGLAPAAGAPTLDLMRRHLGPLHGWPPLFASLAEALVPALGPDGALVIEDCHYLGDAHRSLQLLSASVLAALGPGVACILAAERPLPPLALPDGVVHRAACDLRIPSQAFEAQLAAAGCELPSRAARRAVALLDGRAEALHDLCAAVRLLGPAPVQQAVERAADGAGLLARVARASLVMADADEHRAHALALHLGYVDPGLLAAALGSPRAPAGPWIAALEGGWLQLKPIWRAALQEALRPRARLDRQTLQLAAARLVELGAVEQAVPLYLELGDRARAAEAIARVLEPLVSLGRWETLEEWMSQLPTSALEEWPWLVYVGGELAAAQGQLATAQQAFALATRLFEARRGAAGWCQSLLAESTLAAWRGDLAQAEARALAASSQARAAGLLWQGGWAAWQLGCLAVAGSELDKALVYFGQTQEAAAQLDDQLMLALPRQAELLVRHERELRRESEHHRAAYWAAEEAAHEATEQLNLLLAAPQHNLDALLEAHGWARLPLMLKLVTPAPEAAPFALAERSGVWGRLLGILGLRRGLGAPAPPAQLGASFVAPVPPRMPRYVVQENPAPLAADLPAPMRAPAAAAAEAPPIEQARQLGGLDLAANGVAPRPARISLAASMLGPFHVTIDERAVESWPSGRGRSVLKYLLSQRPRPVPRDVLMEFFWPESSPESARNSLNVAVHGLRQAFRPLTEDPVVIFESGAYRLSPALEVWVDVEEFERHVESAQRHEAGGRTAAAAAEYEVAIELYGADFLSDDPYEDWPALTRERLRMRYLDALDRLSQIYFAQGQYGPCASLCQRTLAADNCREDAHCRLMRCHARLGQYPLALRQYQACAEALRAELDVEPSPATVELCERIRRREAV